MALILSWVTDPYLYALSCAFFLLVFLFALWRKQVPLKRSLLTMPGPLGIPWCGPLWDVEPEKAWLSFYNWSLKFGPMYQVTLFGKQFICISDAEIARELLNLASDRPNVPLISGSKEGGRYLPFLGHNRIWTKQRKFGTVLTKHAFQSKYRGCIQSEISQMLSDIRHDVHSYDLALKMCFSRVSCRLAWGTAAPAAGLAFHMEQLMKHVSPAGRVTNLIAPLRHLPKALSSDKRAEEKRQEAEYSMWHGLFTQATLEYNEGTLPPCYVSDYWSKGDQWGLDERERVFGVGMMATVSNLTLTTPMSWFVIAMAMHPEWQTTLQQEVDSVVKDGMLDYADISSLPILRAAILETLRWRPVFPAGIPHELEQDTIFRGYKIPVGTSLIACEWSISRNPIMYPEPERYNPGRWLDPSYPTFKEPLTEFPKLQGYHGYGFGRRACIGQDHSSFSLLSVAAAVLSAFDIRPCQDANGKPVPIRADTANGWVIPTPATQKLTFQPRPSTVTRMNDTYEESMITATA